MKTPSFKLVLVCAILTTALFAVSIVIGVNLPGSRVFDFVFTQRELHSLMSQYSAENIAAHRWLTLRVDTIFPFAYGAFFYFSAQRYANTPWVYLLIFWVIVGTIFDFTENAAQLEILNGEDSFALKTVFTRAKFVFLAIPIVFCSMNFCIDVFSGGNHKVRMKN
jgi:hypothetical protein